MLEMLVFKGNFIEVCEQVGLHQEYAYKNTSKDEYVEQIYLDVPHRTRLASFYFSIQEIAKKLSNTNGLKNFSYTQGNFTAAVFAESSRVLTGMILFPEHFEQSNEKSGHYSFYFLDKNGKGIGVSFGYLFDPIENKYLYSIALIEDPELEPENRKVTWFIDPKILGALRQLPIADNSKISEGALEQSLSSSFENAIHSEELQELVSGIVTDEGINTEVLQQLEKRVSGSTGNKHNIDSYELKNELFLKFFEAYPAEKVTPGLSYFNDLRKETGNNFWHDDDFENDCIALCKESLNNPELTPEEKEQLLKIWYAIKFEYLEEILIIKGKHGLLEQDKGGLKKIKESIQENASLSKKERKLIDQYFAMWCLPNEGLHHSFSKRSRTEFIFETLNMLIGLFSAFCAWVEMLAVKKNEEKASNNNISLEGVHLKLEEVEEVLIKAEGISPEIHLEKLEVSSENQNQMKGGN